METIPYGMYSTHHLSCAYRLTPLSDGPEIEFWCPVGFDGISPDMPGRLSNIPYIKEQIRLSRIVESMMTNLFSPRSSLDGIVRRSCLDNLNIEFCEWNDWLPEIAKWNKWTTDDNVPFSGVATLQYVSQFHISVQV